MADRNIPEPLRDSNYQAQVSFAYNRFLHFGTPADYRLDTRARVVRIIQYDRRGQIVAEGVETIPTKKFKFDREMTLGKKPADDAYRCNLFHFIVGTYYVTNFIGPRLTR